MTSKDLVRKIYHAGAGMIPPVLYLFFAKGPAILVISLACMALVLAFEYARLRTPAFNEFVLAQVPVGLKSDERDHMAAHGYIVIAFFLVILCTHRGVAIPAMGFLACGDPAGAIVGTRWGRHKIGRGPKSYEGTAACFLASLLVGVVLTFCLGFGAAPGNGGGVPLWIVAVGAAAATGAELYHWKLDDNFVIPVASSAVMEVLLLVTS
jgi:dolichol kinase